MDSKRPDKLNSKDALSQVRKRNIEAGLLDNPFDQDRKDIDKDRKLLDKAKSDAGSMAFIQAGLLWMEKGNLGDAAPAVTEYSQALKGLRGEDRELKKMDLALRGADIAFKQGNVKAARDLTTAAEKRLDTFDLTKFTNMQQAQTQGLANRIKVNTAILAKDTQIAVGQMSANKLDGTGQKLAAARQDPDFYKPGPDGQPVFDFGKYITATASTMYPGKTKADIEIARDAMYGQTFKDILVSEGTEVAQKFLKDFPPGSIYGSKSADSIIGN